MTNYLGGAGNNSWTITTADGPSTVDGGSGRDTLTVSIAGQTVAATATWDGVNGTVNAASTITFTNIETLNIHFGTGNDTFQHTGSNVAHLFGGAGSDTFYARAHDTVDGGDGIDAARFDFSDSISPVEFLFGSGATDTARIGGVAAASVKNTEVIVIDGGDGDDRIGGSYIIGLGFAPLLTGLFGNGGTDTAVVDISGADHSKGGTTSGGTYISGWASPSETGGYTKVSLEGIEALDFTGTSSIDAIDMSNLTADSILRGRGGGDTLVSGSGNDLLDGGDGDDSLDGASGSDTASYADALSAVAVALYLSGSSQFTGGAGSDTLNNIENLLGSDYDDELAGDAGDNVLEGGLGDDTLNGAAGIDTASYARATAGVTVDLSLNTAQNTGAAGMDYINNVENLTGSAFADTLAAALFVGGTLAGGAGNDVLIGRLGDDTLDGGQGTDAAVYTTASSAITVSLAVAGPQATGGAGTDTLISIANLTGSGFDDHLSGNGNGNVIDGASGNDMLYGAAGADTLVGGAGNDLLDGGAGADKMKGGADNDTYMVDNSGDVVLENAGEGNDIVHASISYTLALNVEQLVLTGTAGISGVGNAQAQTITGNAGANTLSGLDGSDVLNGGSGADVLLGGHGADSLSGGFGADWLDGGRGADVLIGGSGSDAFVFGVLETSAEKDTVNDFVHDVDQIVLDRAAFAALAGHPAGALDPSELSFGTAASGPEHLIYDQASGALFYDPDGAGGHARIQIAYLENHAAVDAGDFVLV